MSISRRRFLGGAGALVALPAFESLLPSRALAQTAAPVKRFLVYFLPNGRVPATWVPPQQGTAFTFPTALKPLEALRSDVIATSGLYHTAAHLCKGAADHAIGCGPLLSNVPFDKPGTLQNEITLDQLLVRELKPGTRFPSLQWGAGQPTACDFGASCTYTQTVSWAGPGAPLGPVTNAQVAFNQLFAGAEEGATQAEQARRRESLKSVLDYVTADAASLNGKLSASDRVRLDEYLSSVRELEQRIARPAGEACAAGQAPSSALDYPAQVKAFNDLIVLAFRCDQTRVISFMIEYGLSNRSHPFLSAPGGHHALTHGGAGADSPNQLLRLETWQCTQAAYVAGKLKETKDEKGVPLLDNTAMLLLPDMGDGGSHNHDDLAPVLVGKLGGALRTGRSSRYASAPMGNLYVTLLQAFGVGLKKFGVDGVAPLTDLLT